MRFLGVLMALLLFAPSVARAFECTPVPQCPPKRIDPDCVEPPPVLTQAWNQRCVPFMFRKNDLLFGPDREEMAIRAFSKWTDELAPGTDMTVVFAGYTDQGAGFEARDPGGQRNVLMTVTDPQEAAEIFEDDPDVLALTLTTFSTETGEIFDADIAFNATSAVFTDVGPTGCSRTAPNAPYDIENTLVHEVGHFFGFDHVAAPDATMFESAQPCETLKRDLTRDEREAMTTTYPFGQPTMTCIPPMSYVLAVGDADDFRNQCERINGCGCSLIQGAESRSPLDRSGFVLLGILILLAARPRARVSRYPYSSRSTWWSRASR